MPPILVYEHNRPYVIEQFHNGHFDYIDVVQEAAQTDFFRSVASTLLLQRLAESYPWPRSKEEVPAWLYIAADMAMRLHGNHAFQGFPWVVSTGGLLGPFGPRLGAKHIDKQTGQLRIECPGFNEKNTYPRQTPCDPDFLRKIAKDTEAEKLMAWFNGLVQKIFRRHRYFDKAGIFIAEGSYIFVPDNENYEGSAKMLFDEHNHPVGKEQEKKMSAAQLKNCQWRRCSKMISLRTLWGWPTFRRCSGRAIRGRELNRLCHSPATIPMRPDPNNSKSARRPGSVSSRSNAPPANGRRSKNPSGSG